MRHRRPRIAVATLGLCSGLYCGGGIATNDAGLDASDATSEAIDANSGSCTSGPFGTPIAITELNTTLDERGLRFTPDELTAAFSRGATDDSGLPDKNTYIYLTTRLSTSSPFASPLQLSAFNDVLWGSVYPSLTADASAIFYEGTCISTITAAQSFYCLSVPYGDAAAEFGYGLPLFAVASQAFNGPGKFGIGYGAGDGFATRDELDTISLGQRLRMQEATATATVPSAMPHPTATGPVAMLGLRAAVSPTAFLLVVRQRLLPVSFLQRRCLRRATPRSSSITLS